jgi:peptide/nickel transport system substrate-binding protein
LTDVFAWAGSFIACRGLCFHDDERITSMIGPHTGFGILLTLALASTVVGVAAAAPAGTPKRGGTVIVAISDDPTGLNRNISSNNNDGLVACIIYQGLTRIDGDGNVQPMLAKSWSVSPDGRVYTFDLIRANWQDGQPFTSDDVKYTLSEVSSKYSAIFTGAAHAIEAIETPRPDRLVIRLKTPYGPLLNSLTCSQGGAILPAHVFRGTDILKNPAIAKPVGLGPFLLKDWQRGDHLTLERNPNYWEKGKPYLDEIIFKIVPQAAARTQGLLAGDIDYVPYLYMSISDYKAVQNNPSFKLTPGKNFPSVDYMFTNVTRKPFDDIRVRHALWMAVDRDYLLNVAYRGLGAVGTMPFSNRIPWAAPSDVDYRMMYPYDSDRAEKLLDEAGLKRGADGKRLSMNVVYPTSNTDAPLIATAIKAMWAKIGVDLTLVPGDTTAATKRIFVDRDFDSAFGQYSSQGDPALGMARAFVTESLGKPFGNGSGYSNPEVDKMFADAEIAPNEAARGDIYKKVQEKLAADLPVFTLHETQLFDASSIDVKGMEDEESKPNWRNAWLDR